MDLWDRRVTRTGEGDTRSLRQDAVEFAPMVFELAIGSARI